MPRQLCCDVPEPEETDDGDDGRRDCHRNSPQPPRLETASEPEETDTDDTDT